MSGCAGHPRFMRGVGDRWLSVSTFAAQTQKKGGPLESDPPMEAMVPSDVNADVTSLDDHSVSAITMRPFAKARQFLRDIVDAGIAVPVDEVEHPSHDSPARQPGGENQPAHGTQTNRCIHPVL